MAESHSVETSAITIPFEERQIQFFETFGMGEKSPANPQPKMSHETQNSVIEQLKRQLNELKAQVASGQIQDTGEIYELLRGSAANFRDAYTIHQTHDDLSRGQPVQYSPTVEEWSDFPSLIEKLHFLDTEKVGVALITLHPDIPGLQNRPVKTHYELNGWVLSVNKHRNSQEYMNGTLQADGALHRSTDKKKQDYIFRMVVDVDRTPPSGLTADAAVKRYEALAKTGKVDVPIYATDKDVESPEHRKFYQLPPECPIFPLPGNLLDATKRQLSGIHTPHMYVSAGFGTSFLLHKEDSDLVALNHLVAGERKVWLQSPQDIWRSLSHVLPVISISRRRTFFVIIGFVTCRYMSPRLHWTATRSTTVSLPKMSTKLFSPLLKLTTKALILESMSPKQSITETNIGDQRS